MARLTIICMLTIFIGGQAIAAPVSDRELAKIWQGGDVVRMEKLAETGDVRAQHWMGLMLHNRGRYDEAIRWYSRAVEQGDAKSANRIAFFYEHGIGREADAKKALAWHRKGATLGDFGSQIAYAAALRSGVDLARDDREAFNWYRTAAAQRGYSQRGYAYLPLAEMYENGTGVPRDLTRAYAFARAAELTVDDSDTGSRSRARSLHARIRARLAPSNVAAGEQLFQTLVPGRSARSGVWLMAAMFAALLAAGALLLITRRRRAAPRAG